MSNFVYASIDDALKEFEEIPSSPYVSLHKGDIVNNIEIMYRTNNNKHNSAMFICKCPYCNSFFLAKASNINNKSVKSCGCYNRQAASERMKKYNEKHSAYEHGKRYGKLIVVEDLGLRKQKSRNKQERWVKCKCDCGNFKEVRLNDLQQDVVHSCGCLHSYGESVIEKLLQKNKIEYKREITFNNLISDKNAKLKFDFGIYNKNKLLYIIEYDGRQHFEGMDASWNKHGSSLEEIQKRDNIKNQYCKDNNIPLIRIPYTYLQKITLNDLLLETSDFII